MGRRGFTLIELLVVIAVIAILAAILFPVMLMVKDSGKSAVCLSNLRQTGDAARLYIQDNSDCMWLDADNLYANLARKKACMYYNALFKYTRNRNVWICPGAGDKPRIASGETSYKINGWTCSYAIDEKKNLYRIRKYGGLAYPTKCWMIIDSTPRSQMYMGAYIQATIFAGAYWFYNATGAHHRGGYNIAYIDGHAGWHKQFTTDEIPVLEDGTQNNWYTFKTYSPEQKKFAWGQASGLPN